MTHINDEFEFVHVSRFTGEELLDNGQLVQAVRQATQRHLQREEGGSHYS